MPLYHSASQSVFVCLTWSLGARRIVSTLWMWSRWKPNMFLIDSLLSSSMKVWLPTFGTRLKNTTSIPARRVLLSSRASSDSSCKRKRSLLKCQFAVAMTISLWTTDENYDCFRSCSLFAVTGINSPPARCVAAANRVQARRCLQETHDFSKRDSALMCGIL